MSWKQYFKREQRFSTSLKWATFSIWKFLVCCWWSVSFANSKKSKSFVILFSGTGGQVSSVNAFLFSLKNKDNLKPFKAAARYYILYALNHHSNHGPTFGLGKDLHISNNAYLNTGSHTNFGRTYERPPGYTRGTNNTNALLAGTNHFTPSEVEVFYLQ